MGRFAGVCNTSVLTKISKLAKEFEYSATVQEEAFKGKASPVFCHPSRPLASWKQQ